MIIILIKNDKLYKLLNKSKVNKFNYGDKIICYKIKLYVYYFKLFIKFVNIMIILI